MDKAQRADLIRATFHAKAGSMAYAPSGKPRKVPDAPKPKRHIAWPVTVRETPHAPKFWFKQPRAEPVKLETKRAAKVSPLTRITEKWPVKPLRPAPNR